MKYTRFADIPKIFPLSYYECDVPWDYVPEWVKTHNLNLDPEYQRGHVWSVEQEIAFIEFCLQGGESGRHIFINAPGWPNPKLPPEVVDGKQRLTAILKFMNSEIPAFGTLLKNYSDKFPLEIWLCLRIHVVKLARRDVLKFYIDLNSGGTIHRPEEIDRVKNLLEKENHDG